MRLSPEPESLELDKTVRPRLRFNPKVCIALRYYKSVSEDEGEGENEGVVDRPHGEKEQRGETYGGTRSKALDGLEV